MRLILNVFLSFIATIPAYAWDDDTVLRFISQTNPILKAQRNVTLAYAEPDAVTWALQNTSLSGKLGFGGTDFRDDPYTVYGGLQINIPLSSIKEEREAALKQVAEVKAIESIESHVIQDMGKLRQMESELAASEVRRNFYKEKADWIKDRVNQGYSSELNELWNLGSKVNTEDALITKTHILIETQRYKLAKYAGTHWQTLMDYLAGKTDSLGGIDG